MNKIQQTYNILSRLGKFRITFFVMLSTLCGYMLHTPELSLTLLYAVTGIFLLAAGASGINQLQEIKTDLAMERTKKRPIPSGEVRKNAAVMIVAGFVLSGSFLLYYLVNLEAFLLGWLALIWYNLIYTPMKKRFALAVVPGSVVGALPPVVGYAAAGGYFLDPGIITLAMVFFIWQIPHFWLLLLIYDNDYSKAGLPTLGKIFDSAQQKRVTFIWIVALVISSFLIPLFNLDLTIFSLGIIAGGGIWLISKSFGLVFGNLQDLFVRKAFISINVFILCVIAAVSLDKVIF